MSDKVGTVSVLVDKALVGYLLKTHFKTVKYLGNKHTSGEDLSRFKIDRCGNIFQLLGERIIVDIYAYAANYIADKIAVLNHGKICWYGTKSEFKVSENEFVKSFVSSSQL